MGGSFPALQADHPDVAEQAEQLSEGYYLLIQVVNEVLSDAGVYDKPELSVENLAQRLAREQLWAYEQQINDENLYTGEGLSVYAEKLSRALERLHPLLRALRTAPTGPGDAVVDSYVHGAERLQGLLNRFEDLPLIQAGRRTRRARAAAEQERARVGRGVAAVLRIVDQHRRSGGGSGTHGIFGTLVASRLVHDLQMDATQVRQVLDELETQDPQLLETALFGGHTVRALLATGLSGFQQYRAQDEGFLAGVVRGSREDLLARPPGSRDFSTMEIAEAVAWFFAGTAEGIGRSLIDNVKDVVSLFTPEFWQGLRDFLLSFLPDFLSSSELRFELGQRMGRFGVSEERRLATADADEYGRTVGIIFGYALTETVLSFLGLGWVLKSLRGSARLGRLSRPLAQMTRQLGPAALAAAGLHRAQALAASLQALARRLAALTPRTSTVPRELREAQDLLGEARTALAAGDEAAVTSSIGRLDAALDSLDRPRLTSSGGRPVPTADPHGVPLRPSTSRPNDSASPIAEATDASRTADTAPAGRAARAADAVLSPAELLTALERHVATQNSRIAAAISNGNTAFFVSLGLTRKQIRIVMDPRARWFAAQYGNALERAVARAIRSDPGLSGIVVDARNVTGHIFPIAPKGRSLRPDFGITGGPLAGSIIDLTTTGGRTAKMAKYHDRVITLEYARPTSF